MGGGNATSEVLGNVYRGGSSPAVVESSFGPSRTPISSVKNILTPSPTSSTLLTSSPSSYSPIGSHTPSLLASPTSSTMAIAPIIYLIGIPVILCLLLAILITLLICIICCWQRRRKTRQQNKSQGSRSRGRTNRFDSSKSLEAYSGNGHGPHSTKEKETEDSKRYELQTMNSGTRFSEGSLGSHTTSKTLPATGRTHSNQAWNSNPYIYPGGGHTTSPFHQPGSVSPRSLTSPIHVKIPSPHLQQIPEGGVAAAGVDEQYVAMIGSQAKAATLPHSFPERASSGISDPASHYDVPPPGTRGSTLPPGLTNPQSTYDVPKSVLIASGHYKVPPPLMGYNSAEGIYDVPPSSGAIYDVPPDVNYRYNPASELYDVPPPSRPRLNSQPTSQDELQEARRSIITAANSGNTFTGSAVPSHYDVPRHLLFSEPDVSSHYQQPQGKRLSRRNSNPSQWREGEIYDVPREARVAYPPPTAAKPSRKPPSRSHSIGSPHNVASPERRAYPNEVFYDVPPLDPEFLAQHLKRKVPTPSESESSHARTSTSSGTPSSGPLSPNRSHSAKKAKVPPPTRRKPGKR